MTTTRVTDPTSLDLLLKLFDGNITLPELTDVGMKALHRNILIARKHLPAIMLTGRWADFSERPVADATDAIAAAEKQNTIAQGLEYLLDEDQTNSYNLEAHYITGLVVGLALAQTIDSMRERK